MARQPRFDLPGIAQHIVQRGVDRQPCFAQKTDYQRYLQEFREAANHHDCAIHAYVLMTNHVHLLVTPAEVGGVSRMMQAIGRRYVGSFNSHYRRTGTLWEGRFKAAIVGSDAYVLTCYRYIEMNPVRAHMVETPAGYPWSSHGHNALEQHDPKIKAHPAYLLLGENSETRKAAYRALFANALDETEVTDLRLHTQQQRIWASDKFRRQIAALTGRIVDVRPRGRPKSTTNILDK